MLKTFDLFSLKLLSSIKVPFFFEGVIVSDGGEKFSSRKGMVFFKTMGCNPSLSCWKFFVFTCLFLLLFYLVVILVQINGSNSIFFPHVLDKSVELTNDAYYDCYCRTRGWILMNFQEDSSKEPLKGFGGLLSPWLL